METEQQTEESQREREASKLKRRETIKKSLQQKQGESVKQTESGHSQSEQSVSRGNRFPSEQPLRPLADNAARREAGNH
jgi:hypothetical protein